MQTSGMTAMTLRGLILSGAARSGREFTLSSGAKTDTYFDCKRLLLDGLFLRKMCGFLWNEIVPPAWCENTNIVGGGGLGGALFVAGMCGHLEQLSGVVVRGSAKDHGTESRVECAIGAEIEPNDPPEEIVVLEDVLSTGQSAVETVWALRRARYRPTGVVALIDRSMGAAERLREAAGLGRVAVVDFSEPS